MEVMKRLTTLHALVGKNNGGTKATFNEERKSQIIKGQTITQTYFRVWKPDSITAEELSPRCRQHPWTAKLQSLLSLTHNHTHPTTACTSISHPSQRCFFRKNLSVLLGIQNREPKWWEGFEGPLTLKLLGLCCPCKVAAIPASVNRRRRALGSRSCLQEIRLPEDKAPTNYPEKILCIDKSKAKGNTQKTKLSQNMECWRGCIQIKRKKHFLLVFTFLWQK